MLRITSILKNLYLGLITVFKHLFKKSVTEEYPETKPNLNKNFRGQHKLNGECIGCGICQKVCPANAIIIEKDENNKVISYKIDYGKCIFCGNCVYYCNKNVIQHTERFEVAISGDSKQDLITDLKQKNTEGNNA